MEINQRTNAKLCRWGERLEKETGWEFLRPKRDGSGLMFFEENRENGMLTGKVRVIEVDHEAEELSCYRIKAVAEGRSMSMEVKAS
jgi:hypothetical protein